MFNDQSIIETIQQRTSCRNYRDAPIAEALQTRLRDFLAVTPPGPLGNTPRFELIAATIEEREALRGLGTYGFIKNPPGFVVGTLRDSRELEDFGYLMERIVLFATAHDLGTCWLGGTFTKSRFAARIAATPEERIPAILSIGASAERRTLRDTLLRRLAGSDHRKPWAELFFDGSFDRPLEREAAGDFALLLDMVRLGPSASNKQPWRIARAEGGWHFYVQRTRGYIGSDRSAIPLADLQRVDIGIAMCHWDLTAQEQGMAGTWDVNPPYLTPPDDLTEYRASWRPRA